MLIVIILFLAIISIGTWLSIISDKVTFENNNNDDLYRLQEE